MPHFTDPALKRPRQPTKFTREKVQELLRASRDPVFFCKKFLKVQHPTKGAIPLELYPFQEEFIKTMLKYNRVIALMGRQLGKTTTVSAYILWKACFQSDQTILILAQTERNALEILQKIKYAYEELPDYIKPGVISYNKGSVEFDNGSRIISRATKPNSIRGLSISLLYCDEFAFVAPNIAAEFWSAVQPTLATGGQCVITSTPNSDEDLFAQFWHMACDTVDENGQERPGGVGRNGFKAIMYTWEVHPERDEEWKKKQIAEIGLEKFLREHECRFIQFEETIVNQIAMANLKGIDPKNVENGIRWYTDTLYDEDYYIVALDPAIGTGSDYAAIQVLKGPDLEQIAEWAHNKAPPAQQIAILRKILEKIKNNISDENRIYWSFENNSVGEAIVSLIREIGEENFPGILINEPRRPGFSRRIIRRGLTTTKKTKIKAILQLRRFIETNKIKINSRNFISELKTYVRTGESFGAKPGCHDDLVAAMLIAIRVVDIISNYEESFEIIRETVQSIEEEVKEDGVDPLPLDFSISV